MKKNLKSYAVVLLLLLCALTTYANAAVSPETAIQPRYKYTNSFVSSIQVSPSGYANCCSNVVPSVTSYTVSLTMTLQQSKDGRTWSSVKSWDASKTGSTSLDKGWYVSSGYYYRTYAVAYIYSPSGSFLEMTSAASLVEYY